MTNTKTLVLTSKKNFVWHSMQEIIPFIVESWKDSARAAHQVTVVDIDDRSLPSFFHDLIQSDNIVLSCFTPRLAKIASWARLELKLTSRLITCLHNQSSIACWPFRYWGDKNLFRQDDIFISSCRRDADCLKLTYPDANMAVIPFSYKTPASNNFFQEQTHVSFIFVGRISEQKNIHTLFLALSLLKKKNPSLSWSLDLIGKEDFLGSPNMGIKGVLRKEDLESLSIQLEIAENVKFHGYQDRSFIDHLLTVKRWIFCIPSLHSDENFGMAAFQFLRNGHLACLSDWGGHTDFKSHFPDQTFLTKVVESSQGPVIDPLEYMHCLEDGIKNYNLPKQSFPEYYEYKNIVQMNYELAVSAKSHHIDILQVSELGNSILARIPSPMNDDRSPPIFSSYSDPLAFRFFVAYGMQNQAFKHGETE